MKYDYLVVGAGLFGAAFSRRAREAGKKVLVIDRRGHVGGNCHTEEVSGVVVHRYGPHIFHTNNKAVWDFVNRFAEFNNFVNRVKAAQGGKIYSFPINLMTLHQLWGVTTPAEARAKLESVRVPLSSVKNLEEWCLSRVGEELYHRFIRGYTRKQWNRDPRELPASIVRRLPVRLTYDDNYYNDRYQGVPKGGYTPMVLGMLEGVEVRLGVDFSTMKKNWRAVADNLVYAGPIDEYFDYRHGPLEYRSLEFVHETHDGDYQGNAQVNYTDPEVPWTRCVEHKHFEFGTQEKTVVTREYPRDWCVGRERYYPVGDERNKNLYARYAREARVGDVHFGGRLGTYKYTDMDTTVEQAFWLANRLFGPASGAQLELVVDAGRADLGDDPQ